MAFTTCVCNVSKSALSNYIDIAIHIRCPIISIPMEAALSLLLSSIHLLYAKNSRKDRHITLGI